MFQNVGEPSMTYTAIGRHKSYSLLFDDGDPSGTFYFDNWLFGQFESQNVYEPSSYFFASPGYFAQRRRTIYTNLGRTYDSVTTPEVRPTVTINVPQNAMDGDPVEFSVSVENGTPTGYKRGSQKAFEPNEAKSISCYCLVTYTANIVAKTLFQVRHLH